MTTPTPRTQSWKPGWQRSRGWRPELVGVAPGYPKTVEAYQAQHEKSRQHAIRMHGRGVFHRRGVPDGWAGRRAELAALREKSAAAAREAVGAMEVRGDLDGDDPRVAEALAFVTSVVLDPAAAASDRLAAARTLLTFTQPRPPARQAATVATAEEYLAELLGRA